MKINSAKGHKRPHGEETLLGLEQPLLQMELPMAAALWLFLTDNAPSQLMHVSRNKKIGGEGKSKYLHYLNNIEEKIAIGH